MIGNTVTLFREADESLDEQIAAIIVGMAIVVCAIVAIPLAKKCNRKTLLGVSALGVSACLFTLGTFYYLKSIDGVEGLGWLPLADFLIYIGFFMVNKILILLIRLSAHINISHTMVHKAKMTKNRPFRYLYRGFLEKSLKIVRKTAKKLKW